jgi:hypothetical protein
MRCGEILRYKAPLLYLASDMDRRDREGIHWPDLDEDIIANFDLQEKASWVIKTGSSLG